MVGGPPLPIEGAPLSAPLGSEQTTEKQASSWGLNTHPMAAAASTASSELTAATAATEATAAAAAPAATTAGVSTDDAHSCSQGASGPNPEEHKEGTRGGPPHISLETRTQGPQATRKEGPQEGSQEGPPEGPPTASTEGPPDGPSQGPLDGSPNGPPNALSGGSEVIEEGPQEGPPHEVHNGTSQNSSCSNCCPRGPREGHLDGPPGEPVASTDSQESPGRGTPGAAGGPVVAAGGPLCTEFTLNAALLAGVLAFLELPDFLRCLLVSRLFHEAACTALRNVTSVGGTARVLVTDEQLKVLLQRCKNLKTLELDGFLLTPKGLEALKGAPLEGLALAGIETKDDAFLEALKEGCKGLRSFGFICYGGEKFSMGALEGLGKSLDKLHTAQIEAKKPQVADVLVDAVVAAAAPTLTSLTVGGVTEGCALRIAQRVGSKLHTFGYTRLSVAGAPVNDSLLAMCAHRMGALTTLRLVDSLTPKDLQGSPGGPHQYLQPLVTAEGLARLRPLLGKLKALSLSRSCGLPFAVLSDIDCMVFARSLSANLQELELNGLHGVSDAFLHEALDACGSGASAEAAGGPQGYWEGPQRKRRRGIKQQPIERLHSWCLHKVSVEASDISDVGLQTLATALGPNLLSLCLKGCHSISEAGLSAVAACCPNLETLNLGACSGVNDMSVVELLKGCSKLRTVVLNDARISDATLEAISKSLGPSLLELALHRNDRLTDEGLKYLAAACPSLRRLSLSKCAQLADEGITQVATGCRRLRSLRLDGTRTTDAGVEAVARNLFRLEFFHLSRCFFLTGISLNFFSSFTHPSLKCITMPNTHVTQQQAQAFRERNPNALLKLEDP